MPNKVTMPRLDQDMEEGRIAAWLKSEGDFVSKGDVLFEIETDKAAVEVEAEAEGYLHHILTGAEQSAPVDGTVAWLYGEGEEVGDAPAASADVPAPVVEQAVAAVAATREPFARSTAVDSREQRSPAGRKSATPAARNAARALGLSVAELVGTGPGGRVQKSDVLFRDARRDTPRDDTPPVHPEQEPGDLSVISTGGGELLPVVMIHGFMADASGWEKLAGPLGGKRRVHRVELPCHGRSPNRKIRDFAALASDIRKTIDALDLDRFHLIGHSLGAALAIAVTDTRPRNIETLTLLSPAGLGPDINGNAVFGMSRATRSESLGPWMKLLTADPDAIGWSFVQAAAAARRKAVRRAAQEAMADALFADGVQTFDLTAALQRLSVPTRIIWGKADRIIPWEHALRAPGHVALHLFADVGHMPHYETPGNILPLLSGFR